MTFNADMTDKVPANESAALQAELFEQAFELHESGCWPEAARQYDLLLRNFPDDSELLAGRGTLALQQGDFTQAALLLSKSLAFDPEQPCILSNLGLAYAELKRPDEALACYRRAIALSPDYVDAYYNQGNALKALKRPEEAIASYQTALGLNPRFVEAYINCGSVWLELQDYTAALENFRRALTLKPDEVLVHNNCGLALQGLRRLEEAVRSFDKARALNPRLAEIHLNRAYALTSLGRLEEALLAYDQTIALNLKSAEIYRQRGNALEGLLRFTEAIASYAEAIALNPQQAEFYVARGNALTQIRQLEQAQADFDQAISLKADYAEAFWCKAVLKVFAGCYQEALANFDTAINLCPEKAEIYVDRGNALRDCLRLDAAMLDFERALALKADCAKAYWSQAVLNLLRGEYRVGWRLYEWRWLDLMKAHRRAFPQPLWLGEEDIGDKILLIYPEQGLGDFIQFCRYAPLLETLVGQVVIEVPPSLFSLMATLKGRFTLIKLGDAAPNFDFHCPIMSLPLAFKTDLAGVPNPAPYLYADYLKQQLWRERLGPKARLRVGLAWTGNAAHQNDRQRSIPLKLLAPLLRLPFEFHSLQKECRPEDERLLADLPIVRRHDAELMDFSDTAALIDALDLVISVDTSVAHLAGAMAKPVWILLPFSPDYRWMLERVDSPWYPSAKLFRQPVYKDWRSVVAAVVDALQKLPR
jgi:tetratricopeptide (TPR) repeat protein